MLVLLDELDLSRNELTGECPHDSACRVSVCRFSSSLPLFSSLCRLCNLLQVILGYLFDVAGGRMCAGRLSLGLRSVAQCVCAHAALQWCLASRGCGGCGDDMFRPVRVSAPGARARCLRGCCRPHPDGAGAAGAVE